MHSKKRMGDYLFMYISQSLSGELCHSVEFRQDFTQLSSVIRSFSATKQANGSYSLSVSMTLERKITEMNTRGKCDCTPSKDKNTLL